MARSPSIHAGELRSGIKRGALEDSFGKDSREEDKPTGEEESSDYKQVLITGVGFTAAKLPRLKKSFELKAKHNQSRQDITDLVSRLSIYFARLLRGHLAKAAESEMKTGKDVAKGLLKQKSLFTAETEVYIGRNLDSIGKINTLTLSTAERKRADGADTLDRDGMEEFMAVIRECVEESEECTNLIRKMHSGLQMLNAIRAVFVGTSQSRLQQEENATDSIKSLRLKRGQTVADLTKEFGTLVDVRNDCAHEIMSSPRMGFYFMEIMRKSQTESKLERDFATVLRSLDINQEQREEYEGVVNKFKAADEPQILALEKEESSNGSTT